MIVTGPHCRGNYVQTSNVLSRTSWTCQQMSGKHHDQTAPLRLIFQNHFSFNSLVTKKLFHFHNYFWYRVLSSRDDFFYLWCFVQHSWYLHMSLSKCSPWFGGHCHVYFGKSCQTAWKLDRHTARQPHRKTDRPTYIQPDRQTNRQPESHTNRLPDRQTDRQPARHPDRQKDRRTNSHPDSKTAGQPHYITRCLNKKQGKPSNIHVHWESQTDG